MKILSIDTTGAVASVAIVDETKTIAEFTINHEKTHSQTIMPMIEYMINIIDIELSSIDYIACSNGPGSFTGLRIGAATAKGLAHGLNKQIVPVPTLDSLAYNIVGTDKLIVPIMDARRNQVYTAFYMWNNGKLERKIEYIAENIENVLDMISEYKKDVIFLGDGVGVHKNTLINSNRNYSFAPVNINMQRASTVGMIALDYAKDNKAVDYTQFDIFYLRKSQAEREYERNNNLC